MKCMIQEKEQAEVHSIGEPKEIMVDSTEWEKDGLHGYMYSYHMSKERFERTNRMTYTVYVTSDNADAKEQKVKVGTLDYYDLVEFSYRECLRERQMEQAAQKLKVSVQELLSVIHGPLEELQAKIREEFAGTQEAKAKKYHEEVIQKYQKAKRDFTMQYGFSGTDYDRCYNVFGELMDAAYRGRLDRILEQREQIKRESKRYRKAESQKRFHEHLYSSSSVDYNEHEQLMLSKFYKLLAKKYHPDSNPGVDTSEEMTLLNKVKRHWKV